MAIVDGDSPEVARYKIDAGGPSLIKSMAKIFD